MNNGDKDLNYNYNYNEDKYTLILDASQLNTHEKCPLMWNYAYRENLMLAEADTEALDKGTLVHLLLEAFYKAKLKFPDKFYTEQAQIAVEAFRSHPLISDPNFKKVDNDVIAHIISCFGQYVMFWKDRDFNPVFENNTPYIELGFSKRLYEDNKKLYVVEGKIDMIYDAGNRIYGFVDHKSQSRETRLYPFRPQMKTYAWATGLNYGMINYFGLQKGKLGFRREAVNIPDWMISQWEAKMLEIFDSIYWQDTFCPGKPPEKKFRQNFSSCAGSFDSNPCQYHYLCEVENNELRENIKQFKYVKGETWEPWSLYNSGIQV